MKKELQELLAAVAAFKSELHDRDFLLTWDHPLEEIKAVLSIAGVLEEMYHSDMSTRVFESGIAVSLFRDKSTRTRFSFASAASLLGLSLVDLEEGKSQIAHGETVRETANMISFLAEVIGIRDDMFPGRGHEYMLEVARAVEDGHREGVLPQRTCVINLQCDRDHPTQTLADLKHLEKTFGSLESLRGRRIAMTWAYSPSYGKPLSVPQGIISLMTRFGMDVVLAHPQGYDLRAENIETARRFAEESGGSFTVVNDMREAFRGADIVYPKSWAPHEVMQRRSDLLRAGRTAELDELERECLAENARHRDWECTEEMMKLTRDGRALYMHCLPADITGVSCEAGEVAASVFDRYRVPLYHQAEHKLYVIAALIMLTRFADPVEILKDLAGRAHLRRGRLGTRAG